MVVSFPALLLALVFGACVAILLTPYVGDRRFKMEQRHEIINLLQKDRLTYAQKIQIRLDQAQVGLTVVQYAVIAAFCGASTYAVCSMVLHSWWMSLPTLVAGMLFAERIVHILGLKNRERFEEENVRALRIMASSLRTSPSYLHAFDQVAKNPFVAHRVRTEYERVVDLLRGQIPLETAMRQLYHRTGSEDVFYLATIVQIQRELGGDMAKSLDLAASFILRRKQMQRKQRSTMSQILSQVNLLSVMPFVFVISLYINNPKHFDPLVATPGGRFALLGAFVSILLGGELIRYFAVNPLRKSR